MIKFDYPFEHFIIKNFLSTEHYTQVYKEYSKVLFFLDFTDKYLLEHSDEISKNENFSSFFKNLDKTFSKVDQERDYWYTAFCFLYNMGHYKVCQDGRKEFDGRIESCKYLFTYYIEDYPSGELILYNKDFSNKKVIKVEKNTLIIFKVHEYSYYEVSYCYEDGRKAITGGFNTKDSLLKEIKNEIFEFTQNIVEDPYVEGINAPEGYFCYFSNMNYEFNVISSTVETPFTNRRLLKLQLKDPFLPKIKGYKLIHYSFYKIRRFDYLLLNDPINTITDKLDLFCFKVGNFCNEYIVFYDYEAEDDFDQEKNFLLRDCWLFVKRKKMDFFIKYAWDDVYMAHFVYEKE
ncbi:proline hydroxylase [Tubulinosema ratisbonensis]|uniref:Proline hydroxylase n=1 Tax=Tubulinosema ratisbonensis TaxID=291195 RepID=A0A437AMF7_9MICR|nr:proline hydroxylase [Tubulinosema ratisbonensis]